MGIGNIRISVGAVADVEQNSMPSTEEHHWFFLRRTKPEVSERVYLTLVLVSSGLSNDDRSQHKGVTEFTIVISPL